MANSKAADWRALCLFEAEQPTFVEVVGGIGFAVGAFVAIPVLALLSALLLGAMQSVFGTSTAALPPPPIEVLETHFVRLGKKKQPRALPSKEMPEVPQQAPVPEGPQSDPVATVPTGKVDKGMTKPKDKRDKPDEDLLSQLGERAGAISDLSKGPELEGDPDGIAEGTKATGTDREIYIGKLYSYFRRGFQTPTSISEAELQKLTCVLELSITEDGRVGSYEITRPSGNESFDAAVRRRVDQAEGAELPAPPESIANQVLGKTISLRFFGRNFQ
ncbi:MAG: TonB C-terminal domain-containing protein [Deltaproteobacteria bacterium]|nr:TonB C-terminal domain-containing protein [Deltaproteobacteria bacterium]